LLKAVIFDMDGVIVDTEPMHAKAAVLALKKFNVDTTVQYAQQFIGSTIFHMAKTMIDDFKINVTVQQLVDANNEMKALLHKTEGHIVIPYITQVMEDLHNNGIKLIIASSSEAPAIEEVIEAIHMKELFNGYVSGCTVSHPKPAPDIFLKAAERLGVAPEECLVIEDSYNGVTAAKAAGMTCIGYVNPNSGNQDLSQAEMLVEGFDEVDYEFINSVYRFAHMEPATILTTDHFIIRELSIDDIDDLYHICLDPDIKEYLDGFYEDLAVEKEKHKAYIENIYRFYGFGLWGVFMRESNQLVGRCGIEYKSFDNEDVYEIGYLLAKPYQGHGYAKEFVTEVLNYCFTELNIRRIIAVIDKINSRSIRLAEQVGMQRIGECIRNNRNCYKYEATFHL
jgi:beta-phosphoglucomutase family hydrolase